MAIAQNKRYMAGLHHVVAGRFKLGTDALDDMTRKKRRAEEKEIENVNKKVGSRTQQLLLKEIAGIEPHNF